ncbi:MAG: hypothetical protein AAFR65_04040 [Pseudomonadota bacterium]
MQTPVRVTGTVRVAEAASLSGAIAARQRGSAWLYWAILLLLITLGAGLTIPVDVFLLDTSPGTTLPFGVILGCLLYFLVSRLISRRFMRRRFRENHDTIDLEFSRELLASNIIFESAGVRTEIQYSAVSDYFQKSGYVVLIASFTPFAIPERCFPEDGLKSFLATLNDRVSKRI